jgi:DNA-directed RNA polymerase subunit RPC12/RpoP
MIRFHCENCGQKFSVPQTSAGKKGRCPKCKKVIVVPEIENAALVENQPEADASKISSRNSILDSRLFEDIPKKKASDKYKALDDLRKLQAGKVETELPPERKLPWIIDIFLYPANFQGIIFLAIAVLVPLILQLASLFLYVFGLGLLFSLLDAVIGMYVYWFLAQCVRDSAVGCLRAPETMAETPDIWELLWQVLELFACLVLCAIPAGAYFGYTRRFDTVFWFLAGGGAFIYPMTLLAMVMFNSPDGLNPLVIIPSIFSTFFQYCGLVVLIAVIIFLYVLTVFFLPPNLYSRIVLSPFVRAIELYLAMVAAHLLGRFYFKYQEKLNWDV